MIQTYSEDCDYLRKRFELPESIGIYEMIRFVVSFLQTEDEKALLKELEIGKDEEKPISKEKKRGRQRKTKSSGN